MPSREPKPGRFCIYNNEVGIVFKWDNANGEARIHFLNPDGTTRERLNDDESGKITDELIVDMVDLTDSVFEVLEPTDERIPESRRG